ncbi:hypothetical protein LIER_40829 [Lithospermum erythrorhizon]|uniref:Uncharacterized protein n=1 Tax=Lithospermum erythrorhizon TaxID=34254 RepID=A0AAV3R4G3_LITER
MNNDTQLKSCVAQYKVWRIKRDLRSNKEEVESNIVYLSDPNQLVQVSSCVHGGLDKCAVNDHARGQVRPSCFELNGRSIDQHGQINHIQNFEIVPHKEWRIKSANSLVDQHKELKIKNDNRGKSCIAQQSRGIFEAMNKKLKLTLYPSLILINSC